MKCTEFRDLSELLRDGALAAAEARDARAHIDGCAACRSFEGECATLLAPLLDRPPTFGLPPGPYLPPTGRGGMPPWASGAVLGLLLAVLGGLAAGGVLGRTPPPARPVLETGNAPARPAPPRVAPPTPPAPVPSILGAEDGLRIEGRVVAAKGGLPIPGAAIFIDGERAATTDAQGVYRVRGLVPAGSRLLRVEPPGGPPGEALLPFFTSGQNHSMADLPIGAPGSATIEVVRRDTIPGVGVRVRGCRLLPTVHPDVDPDWEEGSRGAVLPAFVSAVTDIAGEISFAGLAPGRWTFQAEIGGTPYSLPADVDIAEGSASRGVLLLDPSTPFTGRVVEDATGVPVAGARVQWARAGPQSGRDDIRYLGVTTTGPDGTFAIPAVPALPLHFRVRRIGAPCESGGIALDAGRVSRAEIRLCPEITLSGICVEGDAARPAAGVTLKVIADAIPGDPGTPGVFTLHTGPDGRFEVHGVPSGAYLRAGTQPMTGRVLLHPEEEMLLREPGPWRIEVVRCGSVGGRVVDAEGRPAPGRLVMAYRLRKDFDTFPGIVSTESRTLADGDGRFLLEHLPPGKVAILSPAPEDTISAGALAQARADLGATLVPPTVVAIGEGPVPDVVVAARGPEPSSGALGDEPTMVEIRGRVLDPDGAPLPGAILTVQAGDMSLIRTRGYEFLMRRPLGAPVAVAADGTFIAEVRLGGGPGSLQGAVATLLATSSRHPTTLTVVRTEGRDIIEEVVVQFERGLVLKGKVLHDDGTPAAHALIEAIPQYGAGPATDTVRVEAIAAEDGTFRIENLRACPHTLHIGRDPGPVHVLLGALPGGDPLEIHLPPGDGVRTVRRRRTNPKPGSAPPPPSPSVRGRITGLLGWKAIVVGIVIFDPRSAGGDARTTGLDEAGRFESPFPAGRRFSVAANLGEDRWIYADDLPSDAEVVLPLGGPSTGLLRGRVVTAAGAAAARVPVHAVRLPEPGGTEPAPTVRLDGRRWWFGDFGHPTVPLLVRTSLTGEDGSFDLGTPPGRWAVFAGFPGSGDPAPGGAVPWSASDPKTLEVPLAAGGILRFQGVNDDAPADAFPLASAEVRLEGFLAGSDGPTLAVRLLPGDGGAYEFRGLPPVRCTIFLLDFRGKITGRGTGIPGDGRAPPLEIPVRR